MARALARALPAAGWQVTVAAGSLGRWGEPSHAASFFSGVDVLPLDYSPALALADPLAARVPFPPSFEDRPGAPDRVFAAVDDAAQDRLVAAWIELLGRAGAGAADLLHLHHLTPANAAAARVSPRCRCLASCTGPSWRCCARSRQERSGLAPRAGMGAAAASVGGVLRPAGGAAGSGSGSGPASRTRASGAARPPQRRRAGAFLAATARDRGAARVLAPLARRAAARLGRERPAGQRRLYDEDLAPFRAADTVFLYVGRHTAVKRLPLLISAHARAVERLDKPAPLVLVGGHPGDGGGASNRHSRRLGNQQVYIAGWRPHEQLPQALNAADALVLPSVAEAFGLVLIEAIALGLPAIATRAHGPAAIVANGARLAAFRPTTRTRSSTPSSPPPPAPRNAERAADAHRQTATATAGTKSPPATQPSTKNYSPPHPHSNFRKLAPTPPAADNAQPAVKVDRPRR